MSGDFVIACTCGAELHAVCESVSAPKLISLFHQAHSGEGHEAAWPRLLVAANRVLGFQPFPTNRRELQASDIIAASRVRNGKNT